MDNKLTLAIGIQSPDKEQIKKIAIEPNQEERKYFFVDKSSLII